MNTAKPKPPDSPLPPEPKSLSIISIAGFTACALLSVNLLEVIWGIEPRWSWFPYSLTGSVLVLCVILARWRIERPPFGPYAPPTRRSNLIVGLIVLAVFAAVLTTTATAHPPTTEEYSYWVQVE